MFGFVSVVMATVRIQAEVLLWLIVLEEAARRTLAMVSRVLALPLEEQEGYAGGWWQDCAALGKCIVTVALLLRILKHRFSPGTTIHARCSRRSRREQTAAVRFSTKMAFILGAWYFLCLITGLALQVASFDRFLFSGYFYSSTKIWRPAGAFRAGVTSMVRDPILEEVFYRGVVFDRLVGTGDGAHRGSAASSFLFGGMHMILRRLSGARSWQVYHQAAMAACIGYVYCLLFALSGSLVPTVLLHSLNNVTALFFCSYDTLYNSPNSNCAHDLMVGVTADVISAPPNAASMDSSSLKTDATPSRGRCCNGWTGLTWIGAQLATAGVYALVGTACLKRVRSLDRKHSLEEMSAAPTTAPPRSCGSKAT